MKMVEPNTDAEFEKQVETEERIRREVDTRLEAEATKKKQQGEYVQQVMQHYGEKFEQADGATKLAMINQLVQGAIKHQKPKEQTQPASSVEPEKPPIDWDAVDKMPTKEQEEFFRSIGIETV